MCEFCERTKKENGGWTDPEMKKIFDDYNKDIKKIFEEYKSIREQLNQNTYFLLDSKISSGRDKSFLKYLLDIPTTKKFTLAFSLIAGFVGMFMLATLEA